MGDFMDNMHKNSKAKIKANAKYTAKTYSQLKVSVKPSDYEIIDEHCKSKGISKASFIVKACRYCIDQGVELD